jgi:hypothetical protein
LGELHVRRISMMLFPTPTANTYFRLPHRFALRGPSSDWDRIAKETGDSSWSWKSILPFAKKVSTASYSARTRPVMIRNSPNSWKLSSRQLAAGITPRITMHQMMVPVAQSTYLSRIRLHLGASFSLKVSEQLVCMYACSYSNISYSCKKGIAV